MATTNNFRARRTFIMNWCNVINRMKKQSGPVLLLVFVLARTGKPNFWKEKRRAQQCAIVFFDLLFCLTGSVKCNNYLPDVEFPWIRFTTCRKAICCISCLPTIFEVCNANKKPKVARQTWPEDSCLSQVLSSINSNKNSKWVADRSLCEENWRKETWE